MTLLFGGLAAFQNAMLFHKILNSSIFIFNGGGSLFDLKLVLIPSSQGFCFLNNFFMTV